MAPEGDLRHGIGGPHGVGLDRLVQHPAHRQPDTAKTSTPTASDVARMKFLMRIALSENQ